ncbi:NAD(P)-binding protein [Lojkania enalia]|uniref:NAD(P)-binding protein n=1 Tax=Lojkania enalia TaxID=147567 RepID=A0A9P4N8M4_9PLEO|nr:NAD(P)-binding protein [Didymosphaeria enalia]
MSTPSFTSKFHKKAYPFISPTQPELSARGKVVLVTGSGSGIGQATAIEFAQADAKALILCGRRKDALEETKLKIDSHRKKVEVLIIPLDVSDEYQVPFAFQTAKSTFGDIDIVINSAGYFPDKGLLKDTSVSNFWTAFEVNMKGSFLVAQAFLRTCPPSEKHPKILIILSSALAVYPGSLMKSVPAAYPITKLAEFKFAEYLAVENPDNFRVYAIHPGVIDTDMSKRSIAMAPDPEALRTILNYEDVELSAGFMLWLCSERGRCMPSGRALWINWDVDELEARAHELKKDPFLLTIGVLGWPFARTE